MAARYHVVCRDCPEEGVYRGEAEAAAARQAHAAETDHRVAMENVTAGEA